MNITRFIHQLASPPYFYRVSGMWLPWLSLIFLLLFMSGLYEGLVIAPTDYEQGEAYRIIYVHVPSAWMSLFIYIVMAVSGAIGLIWHIKLAEVISICSAPVGASFTFLALVTGSIWGKPMWNTWWVWDARLTSELLLLFLYMGVIALYNAIEDKRTAARAVAILALVGIVNIPIIHYSVEWWNTLHQGPTVTKFDKPSIHLSMLIPLLLMAIAFKIFYLITVIHRARNKILERDKNSRWVMDILDNSSRTSRDKLREN